MLACAADEQLGLGHHSGTGEHERLAWRSPLSGLNERNVDRVLGHEPDLELVTAEHVAHQ
jgi:hypothetical protein